MKKRNDLSLPLTVKSSQPQLAITDYPHLLAEAKRIGQEFSHFTGTERDLRSARAKVSRLNRQLNQTRIKLHRTYEAPYQTFKAQVDTLRKYIGKAQDVLTNEVNAYTDVRRQRLMRHLKRVIHQMCASRSIPDFPVPDACLKVSLTRAKRLQILKDSLVAAVHDAIMKRARVIGDRFVDPVTGEVVGIAKQATIQFHDTPKKYRLLAKFIQDNHIRVNISSTDPHK